MKKIVIFGAGGHARVIFNEIIRFKHYKFLGFLDKVKVIKNIKINNKNYKVFPEENINTFGKVRAIIGLGENKLRYRIYQRNKESKNIIWEKIISKKAILQNDVQIGEGTIVMPGAIINCNSIIGSHCVINTGSLVEHDNAINEFSTISPKACTGGNVKVGKFSTIGLGSIVKNNIKIGNDVFIGSSSFVNKNCIKEGTYVGSPVKKI